MNEKRPSTPMASNRDALWLAHFCTPQTILNAMELQLQQNYKKGLVTVLLGFFQLPSEINDWWDRFVGVIFTVSTALWWTKLEGL